MRSRPIQFRDGFGNRVQPCRLPRDVPIMALIDATAATTEAVHLAPAGHRRAHDTEMLPRPAAPRMFQNAAVVSYGYERSREASSIFTDPTTLRLPWRASRVLPPSLARRVGHDGMRAGIGPGVPSFVPRVHAGQAVIGAVGRDVEGGERGNGTGTDCAGFCAAENLVPD